MQRQGGLDGGVDAGEQQIRAERALSPLAGALGIPGIRVAILNSAEPGAYAWPDGQLYVTRGLATQLTDDELAAALAHELGHLLADGHLHPPASLHGETVGQADVEARADATGQQLLLAAGLPPDAMPRMLHKLHEAMPAGRCRNRIAARAAAAECFEP